MLVTCLYFKANSANPFESSFTWTDETFYGVEKQQSCALMRKYDTMEYVEDRKAQVVILPYQSAEGPKWKAAVVLPNKRGVEGMRDVLNSLNSSPKVLRN
jgi:serine protease inhibitor